MSSKSRPVLKSDLDDHSIGVFENTDQLVSGKNTNDRLKDIVDSFFNKTSDPSEIVTLIENNLDTDGTLAANSDIHIPSQKAVKTYADTKIPTSYLDTDGTLTANSDSKIATQKAVKTYADGLVVGLLDDRGSFDASVNTWPTTGGSGTAGSIKKGDIWYISVAGTPAGYHLLGVGYSVRALVDSPGQTNANWDDLNVGIGYIPENQANKTIDGTLAANSDILYPSEKATRTYSDTKIAKTTNVTAIDDANINDGEIAIFDLTNKKIKTSDVIISTDGTLASNSDAKIATEKAVKTYIDSHGIATNWGQTLIVSSTGNDGTAVRGNLGKPYLTPDAAIAAAIVGDTILCLSGTYIATGNLHKSGVNWKALGKVLISTTQSGFLFSLSAGETAPPIVEGDFEFTTTNGVFQWLSTATNLYHLIFKPTYCLSTASVAINITAVSALTSMMVIGGHIKSTGGRAIKYDGFVNFLFDGVAESTSSDGASMQNENASDKQNHQFRGIAITTVAASYGLLCFDKFDVYASCPGTTSYTYGGVKMNGRDSIFTGSLNRLNLTACSACDVRLAPSSANQVQIVVASGSGRNEVDCGGTSVDVTNDAGAATGNLILKNFNGTQASDIINTSGNLQLYPNKSLFNNQNGGSGLPRIVVNDGKVFIHTPMDVSEGNASAAGITLAGGTLHILAPVKYWQSASGLAFTIAAGGTTVTISGDVAATLLGQGLFTGTKIKIYFGTNNQSRVVRTMTSDAVFGGVNTTFTIDSAIDGSTTSAVIKHYPPNRDLLNWTGGLLILHAGAVLESDIAESYSVHVNTTLSIKIYGTPATNKSFMTSYARKDRFTVSSVATTSVVLNDGSGGNETFTEADIATYNTKAKLAKRLSDLIQASITLDITASQDTPNTDEYFYTESDFAGVDYTVVAVTNLSRVQQRFNHIAPTLLTAGGDEQVSEQIEV